jgi:NTE family protein
MSTLAARLSGRIRSLFGPSTPAARYALVLSGGGARAAYQAGVMQYIAQAFPHANFPILNGVSAGAINAAQLGNYEGPLNESSADLVRTWESIHEEEVYTPASSFAFVGGFIRHVIGNRRSKAAEGGGGEDRRGLVDTNPLREYLKRQLRTESGELTGVANNIASGRIRALSIATTNYLTGQTVTWVQGSDIRGWEQPNRVGINTTLTVEHIMASSALPILFPAIKLGNAWYGDGGIRLSAPISPVIEMGADRILVISTRYDRSRREADQPTVTGYPPPATIIGVLMNAIFLDLLDRDARILERINDMLEQMPRWRETTLRPLEMLLIRPSRDLAKMASQYDAKPEGALWLLTRGLGTGESKSPDWLSMLLFEHPYICDLLSIGYDDARARHDDIARFLDSERTPVANHESSGPNDKSVPITSS